MRRAGPRSHQLPRRSDSRCPRRPIAGCCRREPVAALKRHCHEVEQQEPAVDARDPAQWPHRIARSRRTGLLLSCLRTPDVTDDERDDDYTCNRRHYERHQDVTEQHRGLPAWLTDVGHIDNR